MCKIESIAFANFLKADFEMEDSGSSDDILWLLCGTRQTYTTDEIYDEFIKTWINPYFHPST